MPEEFEELKDWRGTPINIDDTVIYASPKGRSCSFVEGKVKSFSPTNVVVYPIRESFGYTRTNPTVNVRPDRLTVVGELPASSKRTVLEEKVDSARQRLQIYLEERERRDQGLPEQSKWLAAYSEDQLNSRIFTLTKDLEKVSGIEKG